jgi:hypothetical protein
VLCLAEGLWRLAPGTAVPRAGCASPAVHEPNRCCPCNQSAVEAHHGVSAAAQAAGRARAVDQVDSWSSCCRPRPADGSGLLWCMARCSCARVFVHACLHVFRERERDFQTRARTDGPSGQGPTAQHRSPARTSQPIEPQRTAAQLCHLHSSRCEPAWYSALLTLAHSGRKVLAASLPRAQHTAVPTRRIPTLPIQSCLKEKPRNRCATAQCPTVFAAPPSFFPSSSPRQNPAASLPRRRCSQQAKQGQKLQPHKHNV